MRMMLFPSADVKKEAWAWSHTERNEESKILRLTAEIEAQGGKDKAAGDLLAERRSLLHQLIQHDYAAYVRAATALGGMVDRNDLPNVQDVPYEGRVRKQPQKVDISLLDKSRAVNREAYEAELFPSCSLPNVTYTESPLDKVLLSIFRSLVAKETGFQSEKEGILGLLEQGREYLLRPGQTAEAQNRMVYNTLAGLLTPVMPPFYKVFMSGIIAGKQYGPWPWAAWLTSFVTPTFFGFLVGPSRPNRRKDGQLGGLVVEKCKFLQESGCKSLCINQCKLPAQQFFSQELGLPLTVTPNFETQECQWSFGEHPIDVDKDPRIPRGCLSECPTREALVSMRESRSCV